MIGTIYIRLLLCDMKRGLHPALQCSAVQDGFCRMDLYIDGISCSVTIFYTHLSVTEILSSFMTHLTPHFPMTDRHMSVIYDPLLSPPSFPSPCWLLVETIPQQTESHFLPLSLPLHPYPATHRMLLQDQKKNYKAVQSCEEGGSGGAYLEPLVALAQNGANMHNVLGPACIFLRKGFAESRQAVRKSRKYHVHACQERL